MKTNDELYTIILKMTQAIASSATATAALLNDDRTKSLEQLRIVESILSDLGKILPENDEGGTE